MTHKETTAILHFQKWYEPINLHISFQSEVLPFEIWAKVQKKKRNETAAGLNGLCYIPYKKCIVLLKFVEKIGRKIWKSKQIPADWAQAYIILLAKSEDLSQIAEFRPIAITSTVGKIFFSVISDRLQVFMIQNCYITRDIQKGFLFGVPGCLEHTFTLLDRMNGLMFSVEWLWGKLYVTGSTSAPVKGPLGQGHRLTGTGPTWRRPYVGIRNNDTISVVLSW